MWPPVPPGRGALRGARISSAMRSRSPTSQPRRCCRRCCSHPRSSTGQPTAARLPRSGRDAGGRCRPPTAWPDAVAAWRDSPADTVAARRAAGRCQPRAAVGWGMVRSRAAGGSMPELLDSGQEIKIRAGAPERVQATRSPDSFAAPRYWSRPSLRACQGVQPPAARFGSRAEPGVAPRRAATVPGPSAPGPRPPFTKCPLSFWKKVFFR
jgi:hypothetical protein